MKRPAKCDRRSGCPLSIALEIFGDRWTLLILRDLVLKRFTTFKEFLESGEAIASNVLADRLQRLHEQGMITSKRSPTDARVVTYRPTSKGLDLLPAVLEMVLWSAKHEKTAAPPKLIERMIKDRDAFIRELRSQFEKSPPKKA